MSNPNIFTSRTADALVTALEMLRREESLLAARKARLVDALRLANIAHQERFVRRVGDAREAESLVERSTRAEVALALRIHERSAQDLISESHALCDELPSTLAALDDGRLTARQAATIVAEHWALPPHLLARFEETALAGRADVGPSSFRRRIRALRDRLDPQSVGGRAREAIEERRVVVEHGSNGMSWLSVLMPWSLAVAVDNALTGAAMDAADAGDERTIAQLRVDLLVDAALRGDYRTRNAPPADDPLQALRGVRPEVAVTVPVLTLLGVSDEPAVLEGVGPIPHDVARVLAANAKSWRRILVHPVSGAVLQYDRTTYRVPADLKRWVRRRDQRCRFPGCSRTARLTDLDHVVPWEAGGQTNADNLICLCRNHHRLKGHAGWAPVMDAHGTVTWTTPTGHRYVTDPCWGDAGAPPAVPVGASLVQQSAPPPAVPVGASAAPQPAQPSGVHSQPHTDQPPPLASRPPAARQVAA